MSPAPGCGREAGCCFYLWFLCISSFPIMPQDAGIESFPGCSGPDMEFGGLMAQASDPSFWPSEKTARTEYGQEGTETGRSQYLFLTCP